MKRRIFCGLGVALLAAGRTRVGTRGSGLPLARTGPVGVAVPDARSTIYGTTRPSLRCGEVRGLWVVCFSFGGR